MADRIAIEVAHVSKDFRLPHEKNTSIKSAVVNFYRHNKSFELQHALKDASFKVKEGEFCGIIGRNGGGKSTLLKVLAGIYSPTKGGIQINGKLTPFIELGVGFNMELTARENVFLNGALLGFSRKDMQRMYKDIVEFAELERFMDQKLKNYSSGMQVRLAFSIAIRAKSDILLIDEVLAVGDTNFQKKCIEVFEDLKREGRTIVFVSHSMGYIKDFCDRVIVINEGQIIFDGNTKKAVDVYNKLNLDKEAADNETYNEKDQEHLGTGAARIINYSVYDHDGNKTNKLETGKEFTVKMTVKYKDNVKKPVVCAMFRKNPTEDLYSLDNQDDEDALKTKLKGETSHITITAKMPLATGEYTLTFSITDAKSEVNYEDLDIINDALKITVYSEGSAWGLVKTPVKITETP